MNLPDYDEAVERLSLVQRVRGYVVAAITGHRRKIGDVIPIARLRPHGWDIQLPVRIVSETTFEDFREQQRVGWPEEPPDGIPDFPVFFYRVESD